MPHAHAVIGNVGLPWAEPQAERTGRPARGSAPRPQALIATEVGAILGRAGGEIVTVVGSVEAGVEAARSEELLDAAILDIDLHGVSSLPVAEELERQGVPVVILTGYSALPAGWDERSPAAVLRKPVDPEALRAAVARLVGAAESAAA